MAPFAYILPPETDQIHCGATGLALFRRPYFASLFGVWLQMHNGFAIYYAKKYFRLNPRPAADGPNPQGFVFAGSDEPEFTDFLYVSYAVGLTYAMSDTNLEDGSIRRVVLFHSVVSFLFYSTVISAVINLFTSG